ncbi:MAG: prohibitin family protein [Flavobacteriales bacterium]
MKPTLSCIAVLTAAILLHSCTVVRQGEVGVRRTLGKINPRVVEAGPRTFNPFVTTIITVPVRTINLEVALDLPSKEGVNVTAEISILYHVDGSMATSVIENIGRDYERTVVLPVFRASAADVSSKFMAKDMHTGNRLEIENQVKDQMNGQLLRRGIIVEAVLMKSIKLPPNLYRAIEEKLQAEQDAQRMEFVLERERQEAERMRIEAEGIRDFNRILAEGLTPAVIQFKSLEAFEKLAGSPGAKVIITDGEAPFLIDGEPRQ